jgi:hypothetical protein
MGILLDLSPQEIAGTEVVWEQDAEKNIVAKRGEVTGNGEIAKGERRERNCALYSFMAVQLRLGRGAGHVARMWQMRNAYTVLARKSINYGLLERKAFDEKIILKWKLNNMF